MENRQLDPESRRKSCQPEAQAVYAYRPRFVFPLLRLEPLEPREMPTEPLPVLPQVYAQVTHISPFPDARAPNEIRQSLIVYPLPTYTTSSKVKERAAYTYVPAERRDKIVGATEALLGCAILILMAIFVMMVCYYLAIW